MISEIDISSLLSNIRQLRETAIQDHQLPFDRLTRSEKSGVGDFSHLLQSAIQKVNDIQQQSNNMKVAYETGDAKIDITQVMLASQKASLAFEAMQQVRNKLVEAYKEIMNMPI